LSKLGKTVLASFNQSAHLSRLDTVIMLHREALLRRPSPHPKWVVSLTGLSAALYAQFHCTDDMPSLDEAISVFQEAVKACPKSNMHRSDLLSNLSVIFA
jgi:hypothetical protein